MKEHNNPEQAKSVWNKPVMTILMRNAPEENILTACKSSTGSGSPYSDWGGCTEDRPCLNCAIQGNS